MATPSRFAAAVVFAALATSAFAADPSPPNVLTEKEIEDGWVMLFDGETTFGWTVDGEATVKDGQLLVGGEKATKITTTTAFPSAILWQRLAIVGDGLIGGGGIYGPGGNKIVDFKNAAGVIGTTPTGNAEAGFPLDKPGPIVIEVPAGKQVAFSRLGLRLRPRTLLFNNKDLTGWKVFDADPTKAKAEFKVTPAGELSVTGGPGDIQTEGKYADFVLQAQAKTNRPMVNSGIFFRCIPNEYQNGYEVQINNMLKDNDRTKPLDFGTGAIYRRVPARKVVSTDNEWFTLTVIANGPHLSTWVNGYQTVDWTDDRKPDDNPRKGYRKEAGHISIQGHAPPTTADVLFRSIKIAELKEEKK